jgi:hypothetical protein
MVSGALHAFRDSHIALQYLRAVEGADAIRVAIETKQSASENFKWDIESGHLQDLKKQKHNIDLQASAISGELSGLSKVSAQLRCRQGEKLQV